MDNGKKPTPVNVENINLELMKLKVTDIPSLLEYAHTVGGFAIVPTNQGQIKSHAREAMKEQTEEQLALIFEQMKTLAKQVQDIKKRVYVSDLIYNADITFTPVIGKCYFLYEPKSGKRYLSLISPIEWGDKGMLNQEYIAEIRLNADHTWKVVHSSIELG
jgi:enamine deaminase RidA (YjgF/YER057c/UK114 family)